jgi:uncharacterized protein (TIGR02453 family)
VSAFTGFSQQAFEFYERLEADNTRGFWLENKSTYETEIKSPMLAMVDQFPPALGRFRVFRPNRDVRFSANKEPYKTQHGAVSETEGGSMLYVQFSAEGVMAAAGAYMMAADQLVRFRASVADEGTGSELQKIISALTKKGSTVGHGGFEPLKTAPRGYAKDHPRITLLRWKGCISVVNWTDYDVVGSPGLVDLVLQQWKQSMRLLNWLDTHVGASQDHPNIR